MKKTLHALFFFILCIHPCFSQDTTSHKRVPGKIMEGDTVPSVDLSTITVFPPGKFITKTDLLKYDRLVYNVRIVYPYAKLAGQKLKEYKKILDTIPTQKGRKAFIKKAEKELEGQYGDQLKDLSFSQGKILIKLVYRETGSSTFDVVKDLRGGFNAFIWQTVARIFGYDLKTTYDPQTEDQAIEKIIQMIESGELR